MVFKAMGICPETYGIVIAPIIAQECHGWDLKRIRGNLTQEIKAREANALRCKSRLRSKDRECSVKRGQHKQGTNTSAPMNTSFLVLAVLAALPGNKWFMMAKKKLWFRNLQAGHRSGYCRKTNCCETQVARRKLPGWPSCQPLSRTKLIAASSWI